MSCVTISYLDGKAEVLINIGGERTTPSYVGFKDDGILVGKMDKDQAYRNGTNTNFDVKRLMLEKYYDDKVQEKLKAVASKRVEAPVTKAVITVPGISISCKGATGATKRFSTHTDGQTFVETEIYEGASNSVIVPDIHITFDVNGKLNVTAIHESSNNKNNITITNDTGHLNKEEIKKLINYDDKYRKNEPEF